MFIGALSDPIQNIFKTCRYIFDRNMNWWAAWNADKI